MRLFRALIPAVLASLVACGGSEPTPERPAAAAKRKAKAKAKAPASRRSPGPSRIRDEGLNAPPVVLFVVLDTVRADHTSLCGYERPTTPVLEGMVAKGAVHSCRTYAPGAWTHPSHASFFTGQSVVEHEAIWVTDSSVSINKVTRVRPLADDFVTVAERFADAGYQTAALSANMIVTRSTGLLQGFEYVHVAEDALDLRGERFVRAARSDIKQLDPKEPLFLFLNLYDAHDPYPSIPKGVDWVPAQPLEDLHPNQHDPKHPYYRFVKGLISDREERRLLRRITNGYDWGIHQADEALGEVVDWLGDKGWLDRGFRIVVTSDHGEFLGEHRLLRHGGFVYEPVVKVPLLYFDSTRDTQPDLPEPLSGQAVHDLLLRGRVPADLPPVHSVSEPNENDVLIGTLSGAVWDGDDKAVCVDGTFGRYDLAADPSELDRRTLAGHRLAEPVRDLCGKVDALYAKPPPEQDDPEIVEALKAVGYME